LASLLAAQLILIHRLLAATAAFSTSEELISAMGAVVALFLLLDPFFRTELPPSGNGPQDHLFAHGYGKTVDQIAWELITLVTAFVVLFRRARFNRADQAIFKGLIRKAALADDLIGRAVIHRAQSLLELLIVIPVGDQNAANTAI